MEKKFIPLNSTSAPVSNPFQIRTWELPQSQRKSISPQSAELSIRNKTKKQWKAWNDYHVHANLTKFAKVCPNKRVKKVCQPHDSYVECVRLQRRPEEIKNHAQIRDRFIHMREQLRELSCTSERSKKRPRNNDLITFPSLPDVAQVEKASLSSSVDIVFVPSRKLLDLKKPKSGIFINETPTVEPKPMPIDYNPRKLQFRLDQKYNLFDIANINGEEVVQLPIEQDDNYVKLCSGSSDSRKLAPIQTNGIPKKNEFLHLNVDIYSEKNSPNINRRPSNIPLKPFVGPNSGIPNLQFVEEEKRKVDVFQPKSGINLKLFAEFKCEKISNNEKTSRQPEEIATIFAAYAYNFIQPVHEWNMSTLLQIMSLGKSLHEKSVRTNYKTNDSDFDIDSRLIIRKVPMHVDCGTPVVVDTLNGGAPGALRDYFREKLAGIFLCSDTYLLIWKQCKNYHIFDPSGRERDTLKSNNREGCVCLLTCNTLQDVVDLITNRSGFQSYATFKLYEINLRSFNIPFDLKDHTQKEKRKRHYFVVNKHFALIRGGDGLPMSEKKKFNPSMLISCLARIYADIHPPRFWSKSIIDQLRKYALECFTNQCKNKKLKAYNISNLPTAHRMGSYRTEIKISPFQMSGQVNQCLSFRSSQLAFALCLFFENHDIALVQIDYFTIAIWKDSKFFYVFDPFRRNLAGLADIDNTFKGASCLQIHLTLRSMCSVVYNNVRSMAIEGNFFIHGIEISRTRIAQNSKLKTEKTTYPLLLLDYPINCEIGSPSTLAAKTSSESLSKSLVYTKCLSELSVTPCERTCSETGILEIERKEKAKLRKMTNRLKYTESVGSLPASEKIDWFDSYDVVIPIVNSLLEVCLNSTYEEEKDSTARKARKVLLQSDEDHLETLIKSVERGHDYDNIYTEFRTSPDIHNYDNSVEEELKLPTCFEIMPDGNWIVSGVNLISENQDDVQMGLISAFTAAVMANQYNIKFWNSALIDYILETATTLRDSGQIPRNVAAFLISNDMPDIQVQEKVLGVSVERLAMGAAHNIHEMIESSLRKSNDLILLSSTLSCTISRRNVLHFLFIGHPCDIMGFRSSTSGVPTLIRTIDFASIIRRIHAIRQGSQDDQNFVILSVKVKERKQAERFARYSPSQEEQVYSDEKRKLESKESRRRMKILFLKDELAQERRRVGDFRKIKFGSNGRFLRTMQEEEENFEVEETEYPIPAPKHYPIGDYPLIEPVRFNRDEEIIRRPQLGYNYYQPDYHFKIQGTTALEERKVAGGTHVVRPCYFVSTYAILLAIHRPLEKWDFRRVDVAVEKGIQMDNLIPDKSICPSRKLQNIIVDNKAYGVEIKQCVTHEILGKQPVHVAIGRLLKTRKYFLIQFENTTFAIYKDAYFHLFDPYKTLEKTKESENQNRPIRLRNVKPLQDRNTASWVTFPGLEHMLTYVEERMTSSKWKEDFNLFVINILSMKEAPRNEILSQMLASSIPMDEATDEFQTHPMEMQNERMAWLEMFNGIVPWSPLTSVNLDNEKRGMPNTKWKSFDIELRGRLYSLWGHVHPKSVVFGAKRGKQSHAINVMACCMALAYRVEEWTENIVNSIVVYGDKYFENSTKSIELRDYELSLEDLDTEFSVGKLCHFDIHLESVVNGLLYETKPKAINLSRALSFFFVNYTYGIVQCMRKSLCFGKTRTGFFLFDCQSYGKPLFESNQGCAYVLLASNLDMLLYCIVMTLKIPYYNIEFVIHAVTPTIRPKETTMKPMPQPMFAPAKSNEQVIDPTTSAERVSSAKESASPLNDSPEIEPLGQAENELNPAEDGEEQALNE